MAHKSGVFIETNKIRCMSIIQLISGHLFEPSRPWSAEKEIEYARTHDKFYVGHFMDGMPAAKSFSVFLFILKPLLSFVGWLSSISFLLLSYRVQLKYFHRVYLNQHRRNPIEINHQKIMLIKWQRHRARGKNAQQKARR